MAALSSGQFKGPLYHGTTFDLEGKDFVPANRLVEEKSAWGKHGHSGQHSDEHAFATENEYTAWDFASRAGMMKRAQAHLADTPIDVGRVRVHEVAPHPQMQKGVYHADHPDFNGSDDLQEWRAPAFRSKGTIDIMPGRQGTFPSLNWNQFRHPEAVYANDMNHPSDNEIHEGHEPMGRSKAFHRKFNRALWADDQEQAKSKGTTPIEVPVTDEHQMDLFTGKTVGEHADDYSDLGDYHRNNLFGRI